MDTEPQRPRYDLRDMRARRSLRSVALGRNNHELSNRVAREREVEAELERVGEAGLVVVACHLGEHGDAARMTQDLRDEHRHPVAGNLLGEPGRIASRPA